MDHSPQELTQLLQEWSNGNEQALAMLAPLVEAELRRLARQYLRRERADHTLQTMALINEAYVRLLDWKNVEWRNRAHFFGVAAGMMRHILVDYARQHRRDKRGGGAIRVPLEADEVGAPEQYPDLVSLNDALISLAALDLRKSKIVELRFFGGLTYEEIAEVLTISPASIRREWELARTWLFAEIGGDLKNDS
jgi:RNA polymerase sigma factor (TIGR02999 family)